MLVCVIGYFAFASFEHDGHDLILEIAGLRGALCTVVAFNGQFVLVFASDAPLGCNVLGGHAHVNGVEGVVQCTHHHVDQLDVTHARAPALAEVGIGLSLIHI